MCNISVTPIWDSGRIRGRPPNRAALEAIRYEISRYSKFAIQAQRDDPITPKRPPLAEGGELEIPLPQHHVAVEGRGSSGGGQTG